MTTDDLICIVVCAVAVGLLVWAFTGSAWGLPAGALLGGWLNA